MNSNQYKIVAFLFFIVLCAAYFIKIPFSGNILGNCDNLFAIALSDTYINNLTQLFGGEYAGSAMYPANILRYGESSIGCASIFIFFKLLLGCNDIFANYFFHVTLFSLNGFAVYLLSNQIIKNHYYAACAGIMFISSNYLLSNIDDLAIHFYFFPFMALFYLRKTIDLKDFKYFNIMCILGGLQIYFSVQVFIYQSILLIIVFLFNYKNIFKTVSAKRFFSSCSLYFLIPAPLLFFYISSHINLNPIDLWEQKEYGQGYIIKYNKLFTSFPDKIIEYPFIEKTSATRWSWTRDSAFVGFGILLLAFVGLIKNTKIKSELIVILLAGLFLSFGRYFYIGNYELYSPLYLCYEYIPLFKYLRVASRGYILYVFGLSVLAGFGLKNISSFINNKEKIKIIVIIFCVLFVIGENVSWPPNRHEQYEYPEIPAGYAEFFVDKKEALILDLPSKCNFFPEYINEIIFILWQTKHKRNILGGVTGYYPETRLDVQEYTDQLPNEKSLQYFQDLGVTHFVWHNSRHLYKSQQNAKPIPDWLSNTKYLSLVFSNQEISIYKVKKTGLSINEHMAKSE